jgi:cobalamin biosynthesis Mg chelatase CobN
MQGAPRRQARSSARSFFLLPSVLALLALALIPGSAFAAGAGEKVYETEIPSVTSEPSTGESGNTPTHHKAPNTGQSESDQAHGSNAETGGTGSEAEKEGGSSEGGHKKKHSSSEEEEGNPSTTAGGGGNNPDGGSNGGQTESGLSNGKPVGSETATGTPVSKSSGGSSPVVPILIAVVVLAAISIGVVLYRQRKSDQDGSDGRVSSSNAS